MSDYSKSTDFAAKDDLPSGNANKVVSGTEINTEFEAIETAVNSKANTASPTFTGTVTLAGLTATGTINFTGATVSDLGTVTTADINGGTIDGVVIGGASAAAGTFTSLKASTGSSGATANANVDECIVESSGNGGISILTPDASQGALVFGSASDSIGGFIQWVYNNDNLQLGTSKAGGATQLYGDNSVLAATCDGASGSELLTAAGSVKVTDFLRLSDRTELTIASGVVTATSSYNNIDTEGDASTDDLNTINGGSDGQILVIQPANSSRTVVVKDGTGNLLLAGDFSMDSGNDAMVLISISSVWVELSRSNNAA